MAAAPARRGEGRPVLTTVIPARGQAGHVLRQLDVRSVARFSLLFYLTMVAVFLVMAVVLYALAAAAGLITGFERFIQSLFGFTYFRFAPVRLFLGVLITGVALSLLGTLFNVVAAVIYNLISDVSGGIAVRIEDRHGPGGPLRPRV